MAPAPAVNHLSDTDECVFISGAGLERQALSAQPAESHFLSLAFLRPCGEARPAQEPLVRRVLFLKEVSGWARVNITSSKCYLIMLSVFEPLAFSSTFCVCG